MQELEKILKEIKEVLEENKVIELNGDCTVDRCIIDVALAWDSIKAIIHNHMNDGWIPVEEHPKKDYTAVFAVDKHDYYFVAVYDKEHGYRTNDVGADVDNIVAYCLFNPYRPERSEE